MSGANADATPPPDDVADTEEGAPRPGEEGADDDELGTEADALEPAVSPKLEPLGWSNWREALRGRPILTTYEFAYYTDAYPIGEAISDLGPLQLLNTVAPRGPE